METLKGTEADICGRKRKFASSKTGKEKNKLNTPRMMYTILKLPKLITVLTSESKGGHDSGISQGKKNVCNKRHFLFFPTSSHES